MDLSFQRKEITIAAPILRQVAATQNKTNFPFHTSIKSAVARSSKSRAGKAAVNTNLFNLLTKASSIKPIFRKIYPIIIVKKIGMVASRLKIRFSTFIPFYHLCIHRRFLYKKEAVVTRQPPCCSGVLIFHLQTFFYTPGKYPMLQNNPSVFLHGGSVRNFHPLSAGFLLISIFRYSYNP